ncbi:MAG: serpin family protein [Clostridia bacterium]|nr:serpin family protein [Clostridia bacterium]
MKRYICILLALIMSLLFVGCESTHMLGNNIVKGDADTSELTDEFKLAYMDFAIELLNNASEENGDNGKNTVVSPMSVMLALAQAANGADTQTLQEMEKVLANGMSIDKINKFLGKMVELSGDELKTANSIWIRDEFGKNVRESFLQKNIDYYNAKTYNMAFDENGANRINKWIDENTDGMIKKIIEEIDPATVMYIINALAFDAKWKEQYTDENRLTDTFFGKDKAAAAEYMCSVENKYIEGENVTGFIKPYEGEKYSFACLLPDENIDVFEYAKTLDAQTLKELLNAQEKAVDVRIPMFKTEYETELKKTLCAMGMPTAFVYGQADFTRLADCPKGDVYIGEVLHKTFLEVNMQGTKAAAVTSVDFRCESAVFIEDMLQVYLNRPFIAMITDNETNLPIFMSVISAVK